MKRTCLVISEVNHHYKCVHDDADKHNPYRVYRTWWDRGEHRKLLVKYADFESVMWFLAERILKGEN